jgi:hypothetical protein
VLERRAEQAQRDERADEPGHRGRDADDNPLECEQRREPPGCRASANRTASSFSRRRLRINISTATLAAAISRINPALTATAQSIGRTVIV